MTTRATGNGKATLVELGYPTRNKIGAVLYADFLPALTGTKAIKVYTEMSLNDPTIASVLHAIDTMIRRVPWHVSEDDTPDAEWLEEVMDDMSHTWVDYISSAMSMLVYGFSFFEVVYKRNEKGIVWRKFAPRTAETLERWEVDDDGGVSGFTQRTPSGLVTIPIEKGVLHRTSTIDPRPEGVSILRRAYRPWYFKRRIEEYEAIGLERRLAGLPMARIPAEDIAANGAAYTAWKNLVARVKVDEQAGLVLPSDRDESGNYLYDFTLLTGGDARGTTDTRAVIEGYNHAIASTVLADFILLGQSAVGSRALSEPKIDMFLDSLDAWLDGLGETLNRHTIPKLFALNGREPDPMPRIEHGPVRDADLDEMGNFLLRTAQAGMPWFGNEDSEVVENTVRDLVGIEPLPEGAVEERLIREAEQREVMAEQFKPKEEFE